MASLLATNLSQMAQPPQYMAPAVMPSLSRAPMMSAPWLADQVWQAVKQKNQQIGQPIANAPGTFRPTYPGSSIG